MGDESEWMKLPTDEKVQHKAWKARLTGYEEATKLFKQQGDEKSPEFPKYLGLVKKFVVDSNAIAQEKGLEAVLAFVENAHVAGKTASEVCGGIVTKCLNASRIKTKERGLEILLMYVEIERQEVVQDELIKGLGNKQPKVVAGCVQTLRTALREFGSKVILIKPLVKQMQKLLEDRDKNVREETKQLVVEMYRWAGQALKPQMSGFKPVQLTELEAEFEKLPPEKPIQTRFLRSQQDLKEKLEAQAAAAAAAGGDADEVDGEEEGGAEDMDPFELMDPVEILSKLPKDYFDKIEAKKWQERKEVLEAAQKLSENPKLEGGDYHDLVKSLKKVVAKDTNVMLVTIATKIIGNLARGLRNKFSSHAPGCVDVLLEKFREKKITVVTALRDSVDAVYLTTSLDPISESCVASLEHKTPTVRMETAMFLARCFTRCTMQTLPKKLLKMFVAPLLKTVNDTTPDVREASFQALGTAMKVVGEKPLMPFLAEVDNIKMGKIKESCEKAELLTKSGKPKSKPSAAAAPAASPPSAKPAAVVKKPAGAKPAAKKATVVKGQGGKKKAAGGAKGKKAGGPSEEVLENILSDEAVEEKAGTILPADCVSGLASSNWKERLGAMEKFTQVIKGMTKDEIPCQACVRTVGRKPGLKETNFQVLKLKVELISHLALNANFSKRSAMFCLQELVDKISDIKNGGAVKEALSCISEACGLDYVSMEVIKMAFDHKNPKTAAETLNWLAGAVRDFGFKINIKPMIAYIKKAFTATNPTVRTSAITFLGVVYMHMGLVLRGLFEDEKPALLQQIDAEFDKVKGEKLPAPVRGLKADDEAAAEAEEDDEEGGGDGDGGINVADLVPRNDISEKITDGLVTEMADKNWKVRNEALQKVVAILNEAKFITPNIGSLPDALKLRLVDSNKILVMSTLNICQTLATAMGPSIRKHVPTIGPGLLSSLGDSKPHLRAQAVNSLNAWVEQGGLQVFVEGEILLDAMKLENPNLRITLLGWLAEKLPTVKKLPPDLKDFIPIILKCLEDRNGEVRKKAQESILPFMIHTGYESMAKQASKLKAGSKEPVIALLEKARGDLPAKPTKKAPPKVASAPALMSMKAADVDMVDFDEPAERPSTASSTASSGKAGGAKAKPKAGAGGRKPPPTTSKKKVAEEEDVGPPLKVSNGKEQRFKEEKARKALKWNFTTPLPEFIDQLKQQMEPTFSKTLMDQLYHTDFKKHILAIETLQKVCEQRLDETIANLDLILKWLTLRFFDTNTSVLLKALEYQQIVFACLGEEEYHLQELEATSFVPYLVNKVGDPKDSVRRNVRDIFNRICKVYPASKMFSFIIEGIKSKNSKQRAECLEELGCQIEVYGINVCQPSPAQALKIIGGQIGDRDKSVRSAALNTIVVAYTILGETVYKYLGHLNEKDMSYLEERIKRSAKARQQPQPPQASRASPEEKPKLARTAPNLANKAGAGGPKAPAARQPAYQSRAKREFELDIDDNESMINYAMPDLVQHDLQDILDEPVELPKTRMRPPSPSVKLIGSSNDAKSAIDLVISQVASNDVITCLTALNQIDMVLKDPSKWEMLKEHVDQLLVVCSLQSRMTYSKHMSDESFQDAVIKLYRAIMGSLLAVFECQDLGKNATRDILKDLLYNLITILLDTRLEAFDEGPQVVRSVNVLVVRIVGNADNTCVMSALIKLLHESVGSENCSDKFLELVMKCLWKLVRVLPNIINELNVDRILGDIHQFLKAFPSNTWKSRANDTPLRTIKTILHSLVKLKGNKVMSHLSLVDEHSEVEAYIEKVLRNGMDPKGLAVTNNRNEQMNGTETPVLRGSKKDASKAARRISKTTHDMLAEIFKKIGSKENTREGLNDLFDFKQKNPDADLDPFLKKSSQFFQTYIERGLRSIEMEREGKMKQSMSVPLMSTSSSTTSISSNCSADPNEADINPTVYMEKLKVLRARCGLDNSKQTNQPGEEVKKPDAGQTASGAPVGFSLNGSNSSLSSNSSGGGTGSGLGALGASTTQVPNSTDPEEQENATSVADLKRRLERIKNAARN